MELHDFALHDGAKLSVGQDDDGVHMLVDGEQLAGPFDPALARSRVTVQLPGERGSAGVHVTYDGQFKAFHDGEALRPFGWKKPPNKKIRRARRLLLGLGLLNYAAFLLLERWAPWWVDTRPVLLQALALLLLAWWAYVKPDQAWISFGIAVIFIVTTSAIGIISYNARIGSLWFPLLYVWILSKGFSALWADRLAQRKPYRRPIAG